MDRCPAEAAVERTATGMPHKKIVHDIACTIGFSPKQLETLFFMVLNSVADPLLFGKDPRARAFD